MIFLLVVHNDLELIFSEHDAAEHIWGLRHAEQASLQGGDRLAVSRSIIELTVGHVCYIAKQLVDLFVLGVHESLTLTFAGLDHVSPWAVDFVLLLHLVLGGVPIETKQSLLQDILHFFLIDFSVVWGDSDHI